MANQENKPENAFFGSFEDERAPAAQFLLEVTAGQNPKIQDIETRLQWMDIFTRIARMPAGHGKLVLEELSVLIEGQGLSLIVAQCVVRAGESSGDTPGGSPVLT
jgi:hypothetical protein